MEPRKGEARPSARKAEPNGNGGPCSRGSGAALGSGTTEPGLHFFGGNMEMHDFLAVPGQPCIRIRIGPQVENVVEVDQVFFEANRDKLLAWCLELPAEGMSWRHLKRHTGGNGTMAKLLVALGALVGAWEMLPQPGGLWTHLSPMVQKTKAPELSRRVPKPSAGEVAEPFSCPCCLEAMEWTPEGSKVCPDCQEAGCPDHGDGPCKLEERPTRKVKTAEDEEEEFVPAPPPGLEQYLKQFQ